MRATLLDAVPYSIRRSSVKWAIRSGCSIGQLDAAGRWRQGSAHRATYIESGRFRNEEDDDDTGKAAALVWSFKPVTYQGLNGEHCLYEHVYSCS